MRGRRRRPTWRACCEGGCWHASHGRSSPRCACCGRARRPRWPSAPWPPTRSSPAPPTPSPSWSRPPVRPQRCDATPPGRAALAHMLTATAPHAACDRVGGTPDRDDPRAVRDDERSAVADGRERHGRHRARVVWLRHGDHDRDHDQPHQRRRGVRRAGPGRQHRRAVQGQQQPQRYAVRLAGGARPRRSRTPGARGVDVPGDGSGPREFCGDAAQAGVSF